MKKQPGKLFVLSGASGAGKTTLSRALQEELGCFFSVSATTRPSRSTELEGRDYYFLSHEDFQNKIRLGEFLEWAEVHGHYYGTPRFPIEKALAEGRSVLLDLDTQGALRLKQERKDVVLIFVLPPNSEELEKRLLSRGTDDLSNIQRRIERSRDEMALKHHYDYTVVNENLAAAHRELIQILRSHGVDLPSEK